MNKFWNRCASIIVLAACMLPAGGSLDAAEEGDSAAGKSSRDRRPRGYGIVPGYLSPGRWNAITDVPGVKVGHVTLIDDKKNMRTGVTAIVPHDGDLYEYKVPGGYYQANGYGRTTGVSQLVELGEIETPIMLTNTNAVYDVSRGVIEWAAKHYPTAGRVGQSRNPIVGETSDGRLNDMRAFFVTRQHAIEAIEKAKTGPVEEGSVGAGAGTGTFGYKSGIGTSSRVLAEADGGYTVGVLVQSNFGGDLHILGVPIGRILKREREQKADENGSIMIVVATDAPLSDRNLSRLAKRAILGVGRTGGNLANGSGDYVISFSTADSVRLTPERRSVPSEVTQLPNSHMTPLFDAVIEATEEAIYNALFAAESVVGYLHSQDYRVLEEGESWLFPELPVDRVVEILRDRGQLQPR